MRRLVHQPAFYVLLFAVAVGLFLSPLVLVPQGDLRWSFLQLFGSWASIIAILFLATREGKNNRDV